MTSAGYSLKTDGTHDRLVSPPSSPKPRHTELSPSQREPLEALGQQIKERAAQMFGRSLHIREVDAGSCNGCEVEIIGLNSPVYDIERFGIHFVASPRHADMLLVTGPVTRNMELALRKTYDAMPEPRLVVAVGACGCSGGIFGQNYASLRRRGLGHSRGRLHSRLPAESPRAAPRDSAGDNMKQMRRKENSVSRHASTVAASTEPMPTQNSTSGNQTGTPSLVSGIPNEHATNSEMAV